MTQDVRLVRRARLATGLVLGALVAGSGGYWLGHRNANPPAEAAGTTSAASAPGAAAASETDKKPRKLLYYRNPMGLPDTSPTPKKDPMGMDYIPVYDGEEGDASSTSNASTIKISTEKTQKLGVRSETAELRVLDRTVRAAGRIEIDERRVQAVAPKFEGYVERLHVSVTGQPVRRGQPLFEAYSPELVSAQREYTLAALAEQGVSALAQSGETTQAGMRELAAASLQRLKNWDIPSAQIEALKAGGEIRRTLTLSAPASGIVTEKKAVQGMRFMPGEALYQIADLSSVWVVADVFEQDIGLVRPGSSAQVRLAAYPEKTFTGKVSYVYPTLNAATRTVPVRLEIANPDGLLKPAMFAQVELPTGSGKPVLTLPNSAVIDSGNRQNVLVALGEGRFEARPVRLGQRGEQHVEVLDGVRQGEAVVVAANFLLDSESNLKAALGGFSPENEPGNTGKEHKERKDAKAVSHRATGRLESIDKDEVMLEHAPVASLNWPAMTMGFKLANPALLGTLKPGAAVDFEFVERGAGEWVITALKAAPSSAATPVVPAPQTGSGAAHKH